jgi:hypothetical protein
MKMSWKATNNKLTRFVYALMVLLSFEQLIVALINYFLFSNSYRYHLQRPESGNFDTENTCSMPAMTLKKHSESRMTCALLCSMKFHASN